MSQKSPFWRNALNDNKVFAKKSHALNLNGVFCFLFIGVSSFLSFGGDLLALGAIVFKVMIELNSFTFFFYL